MMRHVRRVQTMFAPALNAARPALLRQANVKHVGLAPRGRTKLDVDDAMRKRFASERVRVEGGFNRPRERSEAMIGCAGQPAVSGLNLNKLANVFAERKSIILAPL